MTHFLMKFQELPNDPKTVDTEKDNKLSYKWKINEKSTQCSKMCKLPVSN